MSINTANENDVLEAFFIRVKLYKVYAFIAKNPELSFSQCIEVLANNPEATFCKTFDQWNNNFDRRVSKGEKSIRVTDTDNPSKKIYLFDIAQTHGQAIAATPSIPDGQLLKAIQSQTLWQIETNGDYAGKLFNAVSDYCNAYWSDFESLPDKATLQAALSEGVFNCIVNKFNKPQEFIRTTEFDLRTSDKIKVAAAVTKVISNLTKAIIIYWGNQNERNKTNKTRTERTDTNNRGVAGEGWQATIFDLADDQVRSVETSIPTGRTSIETPRVDTSKRVGELYNEGTAGSGGVASEADRRTSQEEPFVRDVDVHTTPTIREPDRATNTRDDTSGSDLYRGVNYGLSEEDFADKGGAKTRFRNNVEAIKLMQSLNTESRPATSDEQKVLARYVGWGGLAQAFDERNIDWQKEYAELKSLISVEDYRLAKGTVLTAHYTSKIIIDAIYSGLKVMGLDNGTVLEPAMGIGNFFGLIPKTFNSKIYGVELDNITGQIAKHLYPSANISVTGFEKTSFPNNYFDSVITNVPFGAYKVHDPEYNKYNLFIHDYFIAKSLDKLRAGGLLACVTSKGTLDKANTSARRLFAEKAELVGAIRLPNNAFKEQAGTEVTTDILFFRKREQLANEPSDNWIYSSETSGMPLNEYFADNPDMILGTMAKEPSMYGGEDETTCKPDGRNLSEALRYAVERLPANIYAKAENTQEEEKASPNILADLSVKNFCFSIIDGKVFLRVNELMIPQEVSSNNEERLKAMIDIRVQVRHLLDIQIGNCSDAELAAEQQNLNKMYDGFVKKYGILNSRTNKNLFRDDADYTLLITLENYDEITEKVTKSDIFTKRTIRNYTRPTSADSAIEALNICKNETGRVDLKIIEDLTGKSFDTVIEELGNSVYRNPVEVIDDDKYSGWETTTDYLSGNVRAKLRIAEIAAKTEPELYAKNVVALVQAQPEPLTADEISVRLGATWINENIYKQFVIEMLQPGRYAQEQIEVRYNNFNGTWSIGAPAYVGHSFEATNVYGTDRMNAYKIIEHALNLQTPSVYDTITEDGKEKRILNKVETIAVREKLRKVQEDFKAWIFENPERRNMLVAIYNEKFNNTRLGTYDGSYLTFPEMNPAIELKQHQKDAVERIISSGNTLLHHVVGAGKTYEVAAAAMKLRQMGLAQKPIIVVPNHLVMQWATEFRTLYPNANLLIATKNDFEKTNRLKFVSRIATGDWDAVVMAMSSFEKLPLSQERQERKINEEIDAIRAALEEARNERDNRLTVKILEKTLKNKEATLKELLAGKKDSLIKFEELGVDYLFVDEAHKYKNKFIFTKMNNVAGISRAMSKRATDMDMKTEYINELHGSEKGVVYATGTPISNSMVELFTMQSYLQRRGLAEAGLNYFDSWAATFGDTQTALELAPSGQGYRSRTRFAKFTNMPELMRMYKSFADVKTADMLNLPTPEAIRHTVQLKPTEEILQLNDLIAERAEAINGGGVDPADDNMLKITSDGKKLALDPRCLDKLAADNPNYKVNVCVENIYNVWESTAAQRSTQIVFCDLSTPKKPYAEYVPAIDFDVYNHVKYKLVQMGIPENEIAFVHDANTDLQKQTLFENVRSGKVRVLIGSTEKCGAGTNIQDRLVALHHLDTPYRPSDLEQREGRIIRQGNTNSQVQIYTYVTERTFDSYSYQILENKQRFISQINKGELTTREASDIDEATMSYAEIKAITSANPMILRKYEIESELNRLRTLEGQYRKNKYAMQDKIAKEIPEEIKRTQVFISNVKSDIRLRDSDNTEFSAKIAGRVYTERKDAGEMLQALISTNQNDNKVIAVIKGFEIILEPPAFIAAEKSLLIRGAGSYRITASDSAYGTLIRLDNVFKSLEEKLKNAEDRLETADKALFAAKVEVEKPFDHIEKIKLLTDELASVDAQLDLNKTEIVVVDDEEFKNEVRADEVDDAEEQESDQRTVAKAAKEEKPTQMQTKSEMALQEIEPLRVYMNKEDSVLIKIAGIKLGEKTAVWLPKNQIKINKDGYVTEASLTVIKESGLTPKAPLSNTAKRQMK